ncbi:MAG: class I SAM-dependent methyltransferase [Phycisphaeraceae bacterium]
MTRHADSNVDKVADDPFVAVYQREKPAFGDAPSAELVAYLDEHPLTGHALDLGAGPGRNALALAQRGLHVTAIDRSRIGIQRLERAAESRGVADRISAIVADFRTLTWATHRYTVIVAATALDHVPQRDGLILLPVLRQCLQPGGVIFIEVHTTDDPGFTGIGPASECAAAIAHYFAPGELLELAAPHFRIIQYDERSEWDDTHGSRHLHGKAILLGVKGTERAGPWVLDYARSGATLTAPAEALPSSQTRAIPPLVSGRSSSTASTMRRPSTNATIRLSRTSSCRA